MVSMLEVSIVPLPVLEINPAAHPLRVACHSAVNANEQRHLLVEFRHANTLHRLVAADVVIFSSLCSTGSNGNPTETDGFPFPFIVLISREQSLIVPGTKWPNWGKPVQTVAIVKDILVVRTAIVTISIYVVFFQNFWFLSPWREVSLESTG
jgi:hypothetical protein